MLTAPAIRAAAVQDAVAYLDVFQEGARARVLAQLPPSARTAIEVTSRSSWISVEHDHYLLDAIVGTFGPERAMRFWRENLLHLTQRPLLGAFMTGMLAIVKHDPARVIALIPTGWSLVYRDMCTPRFIAQGARGQPVVLFEQLAPTVRKHRNYLLCWHGVCAAFATLARVTGDVEFEIARDGASAEATFRWQTPDELRAP